MDPTTITESPLQNASNCGANSWPPPRIPDPQVMVARPANNARAAPKPAKKLEPPKRLDFEDCKEAAHLIMNEQKGGATGFMKMCGVAYRKIDAIEDIIEHGIQNKVTPESSYTTKFNALEALRDVGMSIMGADPSRFAKEMRNGQGPEKIGVAMEAIINEMSDRERAMLWQNEE